MVRNIPNKFKQKTMLNMINDNYLGKYNYFYLPMDLKVRYSNFIGNIDPMQCWLCIH
jgi:hypothetical protein